MKIAFFQRDLPVDKYGGVANQVHLLANELCKMGEDVTVFSLSGNASNAIYKVKKIEMAGWIKKIKFFEKYFLGFYFARVDTSIFDVVHTHGDNFLMFGKKNQIRTFYGSAFREAFSAGNILRFFSQLIFWLLEIMGSFSADYRVAISPKTRRYIPLIKSIVPCGIDLNKFSVSEFKKKKKSILFVGSLKSRKRGWLMLEIFKEIKKSISDIELWMVCSDFCDGEGIINFPVISEGELIKLYKEASVFCSLSLYEGFGVPLVEALACGTPVISTKNDGSEYVLDNGEYGVLVQDKDICDSITNLLLNNAEQEEVAKRGVLRAGEFSISKVAKTYLGIYEKFVTKQ